MTSQTVLPNRNPGRLGYVVSQYPATNHTFILREIRTLRRLGFDIDVVSIRPPDRPLDTMSSEEAEEAALTYSVLASGWPRILWINLTVLFKMPIAYLSALLYALRLTDWSLRKVPPYAAYFAEAVVAGNYLMRRGVRHAHTHFASTVTLLMTRVFPIGFSATFHGPDEFNDVVGFHMAAKVEKARWIATISRFAASQTMKASLPRYWDKIHALQLGVDPGAFAPRQAVAKTRETFHVLCVGRLAAAKAQHILIQAIGRIVEQGHTGIKLTLVGAGPERELLEETVGSRNLRPYVEFTGACNHDHVIEFYSRTDVFAMASFAEGIPVVLMEAMAMEIPCVATWITGIPELIRAEVDGLLVPPADPDALAAAILRLMDDPALGARLGKSARQKVLAEYNLTRNTERLAEVFRELGNS
jgi:colanic acid/amylovoran biosynthesis glycosyltransferase